MQIETLIDSTSFSVSKARQANASLPMSFFDLSTVTGFSRIFYDFLVLIKTLFFHFLDGAETCVSVPFAGFVTVSDGRFGFLTLSERLSRKVNQSLILKCTNRRVWSSCERHTITQDVVVDTAVSGPLKLPRSFLGSSPCGLRSLTSIPGGAPDSCSPRRFYVIFLSRNVDE